MRDANGDNITLCSWLGVCDGCSEEEENMVLVKKETWAPFWLCPECLADEMYEEGAFEIFKP